MESSVKQVEIGQGLAAQLLSQHQCLTVQVTRLLTAIICATLVSIQHILTLQVENVLSHWPKPITLKLPHLSITLQFLHLAPQPKFMMELDAEHALLITIQMFIKVNASNKRQLVMEPWDKSTL